MASIIALSASTPMGLSWRSSKSFILTTVAIGMFTDLFLYGLIVPILPFILTDKVGVPHSQLQGWTSALLAYYAAAQVVLSLPIGVIADRLPARQPPFLLGLTALLASTIMLFTGTTIGVLILARILQGASAAIVWTVGLALVMDTTGTKNLGIAIATMFSFISVGELVAPVLGGIVYQKAGSKAVMGMAFSILIVDIVMRLLVIEKKTAIKYGVDYDSPHSSPNGSDEEDGEREPLLSNENTRDEELENWKIPDKLPYLLKKFPLLYCLLNSRLVVAYLVTVLQAMLLAIFDSTVPTEANDLFGFDSLRAGLCFIPLVCPPLLLGTICGKGVDKFGPKVFAVIGLLWICIPLVLLRIPHEGGTPEIVKMGILLGFAGIGMALLNSTAFVDATHVMELFNDANPGCFGKNGPYGTFYAIHSIVFSAGLTLGPLVGGGLREGIGYGNMNAVVAGICAVVAVISFFFLGGPMPKLKIGRAKKGVGMD